MSQLNEMLRHVRSVLRRRGVADQDAEDLVHEAFLKVERYEQRHAVRSQEALLVRTAVNLSIDGERRERRALSRPETYSPLPMRRRTRNRCCNPRHA
ncbi:sigma factor [Sphingomonas sp. 7/4-4]|uniref:sigma factor n=1 Tax=Sphingomonas sp. 7/4-4 TaxID=3018446 RepID=UPI0022F3DCB4|nr:sigma factor [Sphingomonas sp. 7/4-4]WBY06485.1 sigma factor [Sphingomonas sp. 7/4-4]